MGKKRNRRKITNKRDSSIFALSFLFVVLLIVLAALFVDYMGVKEMPSTTVTGRVVETTPSQVTIKNYVAVSLSPNLQGGIFFPDIQNLPATDIVAAGDYDAGDQTEYDIYISDNGNIHVDFCVSADGALTEELGGIDTIPLTGYTWDDDPSVNDIDNPALPGVSLDTVYTLGSSDIAPDNYNYYRFWLDVPASQSPGTYKNNINFKIIPTGEDCNA